jgi:hypothetical protein
VDAAEGHGEVTLTVKGIVRDRIDGTHEEKIIVSDFAATRVALQARLSPERVSGKPPNRVYINASEKTPSFSDGDDSERRTREGSPLSQVRPLDIGDFNSELLKITKISCVTASIENQQRR